VLGRYVLGERLAAGSLGTVVAATDPRTGRAVAVKFFDGASDNYAAWVDEMRLAVRLAHPHIVACIDAGHDDAWGLSVLVFARAMGGSLRRALASGKVFDGPAVHRLLTEISAALALAHEQGVVHRDIKPENILALERLGEPPWALTDFGAGRFLPRGAALRSLAGSTGYIAPEVTLGAADATSDLYSLGVVALELYTGERGELATRTQFRLRHRTGDGPAAVIARLLAPDPNDRFPGAAALVAALAAAPTGLDVGHTQDGAAWLLAGDEVSRRCPETGRLVPLGRVPRARRFIHEPDDDAVIIAGDRRVVCLDPARPGSRPATLLASDEGFAAFVASRRHAAIWLLQAGQLVRSDLAGERVHWRVPLPPEWLAALHPHPPVHALTGLVLAHDQALLGLLGCPLLLRVDRVPQGLRLTPLRAPAPLYALVRRGPELLIHCGDAGSAALLRLDGDGLQLLQLLHHRALPVDCVGVTDTPQGPRLTDLVQVPEAHV
jgi:hypothetical protein